MDDIRKDARKIVDGILNPNETIEVEVKDIEVPEGQPRPCLDQELHITHTIFKSDPVEKINIHFHLDDSDDK